MKTNGYFSFYITEITDRNGSEYFTNCDHFSIVDKTTKR